MIRTQCPATGDLLEVEATLQGKTKTNSKEIVMSIVAPDLDQCCDELRGSFCNHVTFFRDQETFLDWAKDNKKIDAVALPEAFAMAKTRNQIRLLEIDLLNIPLKEVN